MTYGRPDAALSRGTGGVAAYRNSGGLNSLDQYILRQSLAPLALILIVTTAIAWMTQSLQRIEIIVEYGQGLGVFGYLSLLIIPSLLAIIIPFALFGAAVYALYRLHSDSEIAVMYAAGVSRWRLSAPILLIAFLGALFTFYVNVDLMPRCYRVLKQAVAEIRADFASSLLRSGEFTTVVDGFTIYVEEARPGGQFVGLLINDYRNGENPETYMAERAVLQETDEGPMLFLKRGNIQRVARYTGDVSFIRFDEWAIDISTLKEGPGELTLELTERYPRELLNPDMSSPYDRANAGKLIAEGHARYAAPLHAFAYVLAGIFALIGGAYSRRGYFMRVAAAASIVFGIRILSFIAQGLAETNGAYWTLYAIPGGAVVIYLLLLFAPLPRLRAPVTKAPA
ncbi:MAG: LptF/LptG family permease [Hyphococcus sp.]